MINSKSLNKEDDIEDYYNPSNLNEPLHNIINNHLNIGPKNLLQIENESNGNCLYLSISYHCFNNFKHHIEIRNNIANALSRRTEEMTNITINNNEGNNIPIKDLQKQYIR